ncbi:MAG: tRNA preQ1(34) S-adenosylmethionine ribosyltransferase-isomerase QueA, partial [Thermodesulfovibrionia bacterium]
MELSEFDYYLPKSQIAQYPEKERDSSRLLVINRKSGEIKHSIFREITEYLHPGDVLVLNDTRVVPARLYGVNPEASGRKVEILLLKELRTNTWEAIVKGLHKGTVQLEQGITASVSRANGVAKVKFDVNSGVSGLADYDIKNSLNKIGVMPLPHYIKRKAAQSDTERYQTVYAKKQGAIAAPTAGLHFTDSLLNAIRDKGIEVKMLTLHVGRGTFKPVLSANIKSHHMDEEFYEIPGTTADTINLAKSEGRRVTAVGTTVTRALEASAADGSGDRIHPGTGKASIFIYPGYRFKIIDALITNFHLPKSTPMMLTSAFSGFQLLKNAYLEARKRGYRFFS